MPTLERRLIYDNVAKVFIGEIFTLLCRIIDSYETNEDVGLPLGNQASQWFALYYLDSVDRLIKERLQIKFYVRYMDDFVLIHNDKSRLRYCLNEIQRVCNAEMKIESDH
jgi:hypothetical protein